MIVFIEVYIAWFFTSRFLMLAVPSLHFLEFFDELFLLIALGFLRRHWSATEGLRRYRVVVVFLLVVFGVSFAVNLSSPVNLALILSSYAKPLLLGAVLFILFVETDASNVRLAKVFATWCVVQFPLLAIQFIAGGASVEAVDDMVGTFGFEGSLELGYLAGLVGCIAVPGIFAKEHRTHWAGLFLASMLVAVVTNSRQVVLLVLLVAAIYFLVFKSRSVRTIALFVVGALAIAIGAREALRLDMFANDYELAMSAISDVQSTRKIEGLLMSAAIFESHPQYYLVGTGPGMYTSHVALNAETEYATTVNYAYYLQKPGGAEEGLGGTLNQSSSSFLSVVGETGFAGYAGFMVLLWIAYVSLKRGDAAPMHTEIAFGMALFISLSMFLQNILEGGVTINLFWATNAYLLSRMKGSDVAAT